MLITYLPPTYNLTTYLHINPPTYLLRYITYLPTKVYYLPIHPPIYVYYVPTYLFTHPPTYLPTYPATHPPNYHVSQHTHLVD
jgi:hypothetical protein